MNYNIKSNTFLTGPRQSLPGAIGEIGTQNGGGCKRSGGKTAARRGRGNGDEIQPWDRVNQPA